MGCGCCGCCSGPGSATTTFGKAGARSTPSRTFAPPRTGSWSSTAPKARRTTSSAAPCSSARLAGRGPTERPAFYRAAAPAARAAPHPMDGKPTKPMGAYLRFQQDVRANKIRIDNEEGKPIQILWKELPLETQSRYTDMARAEYDDYKARLARWYSEHPDEKRREEQARSAQKQRKYLMNNVGKAMHKYIEQPEIVLFTVGHILKYGQTVKNTPKIKSLFQV